MVTLRGATTSTRMPWIRTEGRAFDAATGSGQRNVQMDTARTSLPRDGHLRAIPTPDQCRVAPQVAERPGESTVVGGGFGAVRPREVADSYSPESKTKSLNMFRDRLREDREFGFALFPVDRSGLLEQVPNGLWLPHDS